MGWSSAKLGNLSNLLATVSQQGPGTSKHLYSLCTTVNNQLTDEETEDLREWQSQDATQANASVTHYLPKFKILKLKIQFFTDTTGKTYFLYNNPPFWLD